MQVSGLPVAEVMDTWTKQMGYPVLDLSVSETNTNLTQKRFLLDPKADVNKPPTPLGSVKDNEDAYVYAYCIDKENACLCGALQ